MAVGIFGVWAKKFLKDHSQTEIDYVDGVTAGTVTASKAVVAGANKNLDVLAVADLKLGSGAGTSVTATAAELNTLDRAQAAGVAEASKAVVLGADKGLSGALITDCRAGYSIGTHDYGAAAVGWTLSAAELLKTIHKPTNASGAVNAIVADAAGIPYCFINTTGQALTVKTAAGTGIAIASTKTAWVMSDGTNVIRLTPDA